MPPFHRAAAASGLMLLAQPLASGAVMGPRPTAEASPAQATPNRVLEYQLKASYVAILPAFITWPATSGLKHRPMVIGVLGESLFENHLDDLFAPGKPESRKARLVYVKSRQDMESCDVLFICESEFDRLFEILRRIKGRPILTIGDSPNFARRGVMVNLVLNRDRIGLEVNLAALQLAGLQASPQMLKNAKIID